VGPPAIRGFTLKGEATQMKLRGGVKGQIIVNAQIGDTHTVHPSAFLSSKPVKGRDSALIGTIQHGGTIGHPDLPYVNYYYRGSRRKPAAD